MAKPSKKVVLSILNKLEIEHSSKINLKRAQAKLERAVKKNEDIMDDVDLTEAEMKGLEQMGFKLFEDGEEPEDDEDDDREPTDDELEDDDDEPEKKKKPKKDKKKAPAKKKSSKPKTKKRVECLCEVLNGKLPKKGKTIEEISALANKMHVKSGGTSNVKQTIHHFNVIAPVLVYFEIIKIEKGKVYG